MVGQAYTTGGNRVIELPTVRPGGGFAPVQVGVMHLPAGSYLVTATAAVTNGNQWFAQNNERRIYFGINWSDLNFNPDENAQRHIYELMVAGGFVRQTVTIHRCVTVGEQGPVYLGCCVAVQYAEHSYVTTWPWRVTALELSGIKHIESAPPPANPQALTQWLTMLRAVTGDEHPASN